MPGAYTSIFLVAFDLDGRGQPVQAFEPRLVANESSALDEAKGLAGQHAGVVLWKREAAPAIGEESEPIVLWQTGRVGDFD
ncbi:hypothetical protein SAMN03159496_05522 [Rhizobium sp. NFR07]|uniref:hypothetical protein n=1 Tax=Rhizobium sp. NFR07 TaxID=1566262 RepID=UPI0008EA19AA|nr:hypothetical protein [Rhizobium sp. NFR07]SFB59408.1 hypothetical protein SAMN03159496_05522 [Rhizobium sp. NFR07]